MKIQLTIKKFFFLSFEDDNDEEPVMHSKSDNIEIIISYEADEVVKKLFDSLKNSYQKNLESMRGVEFVFHHVQLLYYKCHKINPPEKGDQKKFEKNNITTALNVLYASNEKIYPAYVSKHNSNHEKQVILLMISNRETHKAKSEG